MRERLDAYLSRSGVASRSGAKALVRSGRVEVGGVTCRDPGRIVSGEPVTCDGVPVERPKEGLHVIFHKPLGCSCSHDPLESPILYDLLPPLWRAAKLEAAGRLDRETSGMLILSNEGAFIQRLTHPRRHVPRRYQARYRGELRRDAVQRFAEGIRLEDEPEPTLPATLTIDAPGPDGTGSATIVVGEGRYHQVRRMLAACGAEVIALHRDRIGGLDLPTDLPPGTGRELTALDLQRLLDAGPAAS